jgi:hypothetical protein
VTSHALVRIHGHANSVIRVGRTGNIPCPVYEVAALALLSSQRDNCTTYNIGECIIASRSHITDMLRTNIYRDRAAAIGLNIQIVPTGGDVCQDRAKVCEVTCIQGIGTGDGYKVGGIQVVSDTDDDDASTVSLDVVSL